MATTTTRLIRIPQLGDVPDVPADLNRLAIDLDSRLIWSQGTLAARPATPSPNLSGTVYWATDDLTQGPNGSASYWDGGAWRDWVGNSPSAGQKAALAGTAGTPNGTTNKYVTDTDPKRGVVVASAVQVRDVGELNNIRAGRVLTAADFTNMGLSAPAGLWNLGDLTDVSGNGRSLTNKGTVPFGTGIKGAATEAAVFAGSTAQALYIVSAGWQQILTGSWGCWFRTAKRGTSMAVMGKDSTAANQDAYRILVNTNNTASVDLSTDGSAGALITATSITDVADDRWHFVVGTADGTKLRLYVDGVLEATMNAGLIFPASAPFNIGGIRADASTATVVPFFGRVDEAFLTFDVLSEDQVRNLYCTSITHALGVTPAKAVCSVRRRRRGGAILTTDFPSTPLRLYNFTAGAVTDAGSNGTNIAALGGGSSQPNIGADGSYPNGWALSGAHQGLGSTDTGLPSGTASRSYGSWFKTTSVAGLTVLGWGTINTADARIAIIASGVIQSYSGADVLSGPYVIDGVWHQAVVVEENTPTDGVKRKLYLDGRLVGTSLVLTSLTLAGANKFRVGASQDGTAPFIGAVDGAFVIGVALTPEQVRTLYNLGSQALAASPKSEGDHIEAFDSTTRVLAVFDTLEGCDTIDLQVTS